MAAYIFTSTLRQFFRFNRLLAWLLVSLVLIGLAALLKMLLQEQGALDTYLRLSREFTFRAVALISAILSASVLSAEIEQRTIVYQLIRPVPRWMFILMRSAAAVVTISFWSTLIALGVSVVCFQGQFLRAETFQALLGVIAGSITYCGLFVLFSLILNRSLIYSLLYAFGWESFVPMMPGDIYYASITSHMKGISGLGAAAGPDAGIQVGRITEIITTLEVPKQTAVLFFLIAPVVLFGICMFWFSKFEYTPREDAE